jgi:polyisoprenoid-binding protein YceI
MDNYFSLYFFGISIFVLSIIYLKQQSLFGLAYLLFGSGIIALFCNVAIIGGNFTFTITSISALILNFLLGIFNSSKVLNRQLIGVAICSIPIMFSWAVTINVQDYEFSIGPIHLMLILYGGLIHLMSELKIKIINRFIKNIDSEAARLAIQLILLGIGIYVGSFFASYFGILLIGIGASASSFQTRDFRITLLILTYVIFAFFITKQNIEVVDISLGKILFGFIVGIFSILCFNMFTSGEKVNLTNLLFPALLQAILISIIIWLGTQKTDLGGFDAYLASLFGMLTAQLFTGTFIKNLFVIVFSLTIGVNFTVLLKTDADAKNQVLNLPASVTKNQTGEKQENDPFNIPGKKIEEIIGNYKIDDSNSELTFQLGPKGGITKGAIKLFSGQINFTKSPEKSQFIVNLPVKNLTTFNGYRDESLMEASYFNVAKFPKMNYQSKTLTVKDDYYIISGDFEMLGIKQKVDVNIKYMGKNENGNPILIGKSSLDRTLFGMQPDPKEGNVVEFQFNIQLLEIKP